MEVQRNDRVGRFAITSRDFEPGDLVFSENPFAFGPKADSPPLCLGCYAPTDCSTLCTRCNWPVCSEKCQETPAHKQAECGVFSRARVRFQAVADTCAPCMQYECITPLRVLLAKLAHPDRWEEEVKDMESHNGLRKEQPIWRFNQVNIVSYLRGPCKLDYFDEELVHTVCGILESNAFEARSPSGNPIRCLFPKLAILSHNCISNIMHTIDCTGLRDENDYRVTVRAAVKVLQGEELFSSYTYSLWSTIIRRKHLQESKFFDCACPRCQDPTEMNTHMSTLKCRKCTRFALPQNPLDPRTDWMCSNCKDSRKAEDVKSFIYKLQQQIEAAESCHQRKEQLLELLLKRCEEVLHPQHAFCCSLRISLIQVYGTREKKTAGDVQRKIKLCKQTLQVLNVIEPGYSRIRGLILYELYTSLALAARQNESIPEGDLTFQLNEMLEILRECATILRLESQSSTEGKLGKIAYESLLRLEKRSRDVKSGKLHISDALKLSVLSTYIDLP